MNYLEFSFNTRNLQNNDNQYQSIATSQSRSKSKSTIKLDKTNQIALKFKIPQYIAQKNISCRSTSRDNKPDRAQTSRPPSNNLPSASRSTLQNQIDPKKNNSSCNSNTPSTLVLQFSGPSFQDTSLKQPRSSRRLLKLKNYQRIEPVTENINNSNAQQSSRKISSSYQEQLDTQKQGLVARRNTSHVFKLGTTEFNPTKEQKGACRVPKIINPQNKLSLQAQTLYLKSESKTQESFRNRQQLHYRDRQCASEPEQEPELERIQKQQVFVRKINPYWQKIIDYQNRKTQTRLNLINLR